MQFKIRIRHHCHSSVIQLSTFSQWSSADVPVSLPPTHIVSVYLAHLCTWLPLVVHGRSSIYSQALFTQSWLFLAPWDFAFFCVTSRYRPPPILLFRLPLGNYFSYLSLSEIWASALLILVYLFLNAPLVMFLLPAPRQIVCLCCHVSGSEPLLSLTQPSSAVVCLPTRVGVNLWTVSLCRVFCWDWVHAITHDNNSEVSPQSKMHLL